MIKSRSKPHKANLKDDFNLIKLMAMNKKRQEVIEKWIVEKQKSTYINIDESFLKCDFRNKGWVK